MFMIFLIIIFRLWYIGYDKNPTNESKLNNILSMTTSQEAQFKNCIGDRLPIAIFLTDNAVQKMQNFCLKLVSDNLQQKSTPEFVYKVEKIVNMPSKQQQEFFDCTRTKEEMISNMGLGLERERIGEACLKQMN